MKRYLMSTAICAFLLQACTSSAEFNSAAPQTTGRIPGNYQAVYQQIYRMAISCLPNGPAMLGSPVTNVVEGQLYTDLGYGEIRHYQKNLAIIPYLNIKIQNDGDAALVSITSANVISSGQEKMRANVIKWANGETTCS